ncbi:cytochrome c biogenesis protein CcdA [Isoptericola sp. b441]|uniref:Cytochrome c biogenesis protein CcdA n=1 Tax=Actinotalea lenta TaxID=3064654 RepID=A0ABT9DAX3_9CELL|nr:MULTISPECIES: cytochrome c biogenesis protein CcdA [unclassified Isoptericola]MDO8108049.1 cytochrome c biogenesis protein CcdA [Isoptericola sp. b441]MDO8120282.1 cytochrome c biogenesis protein CcdA [Isoptericola sp. b490]
MTPVDLTLLGAFLGGLVSFLSPCVLPVIPAYVSVVTGLSVTSVQEGGRSQLRRTLTTSLGFVAGFGAVFVLLGLSVTAVGSTLLGHRETLTRVSGLVVLAMALFLLASLVLKAPWLYQEKRWHPSLDRFGPFAAPVAGVAFGFGWTPCIGPVLTSVLAFAAGSGDVARGTAMLVAYSVGLATPFLAAALALDRLAGTFAFVKRHFLGITVTSAVVLAAFGVLLAFNRMSLVTTLTQSVLSRVGLGGLLGLG